MVHEIEMKRKLFTEALIIALCVLFIGFSLGFYFESERKELLMILEIMNWRL
jgi:hypothetical protein